MKRCKWAKAEEITKVNQIEVCPRAIDITQEIANRISVDGGGALIIDYGLNGVVSDSLQVCICLIFPPSDISFTIHDENILLFLFSWK